MSLPSFQTLWDIQGGLDLEISEYTEYARTAI